MNQPTPGNNGLSRGDKIALWSLAATVIGVLVAVGAWLWPDQTISAGPSDTTRTSVKPTDGTDNDGPLPSTPTIPPPPNDRVTPPTVVTPPTSDAPPVPTELVGPWNGGGRQYAYDDFYQEMAVEFTAGGEYVKLTGGILRDEGYFVVNGNTILFRPRGQQPHTMTWGITQLGGRPVLHLATSAGGDYQLDKQ